MIGWTTTKLIVCFVMTAVMQLVLYANGLPELFAQAGAFIAIMLVCGKAYDKHKNEVEPHRPPT